MGRRSSRLRACAAKSGSRGCPGSVAILAFLLSVVVLAPAPVMAQFPNLACLQEEPGLDNPACTANDVRLVKLEGVGPTGCVADTDTPVSLRATIESVPGRYDIGLWLNQRGSAKSDPTGNHCSRAFLHPPGTTTACNQSGGPYYDADSDACGDVYASNTNPCGNAVTGICTDGSGATCLFTTIEFSTTIRCELFGGPIELSICTSWNNSDSTTCNDVFETNPPTGGNCNCRTVQIEGLGLIPCVTDDDCNEPNPP